MGRKLRLLTTIVLLLLPLVALVRADFPEILAGNIQVEQDTATPTFEIIVIPSDTPTPDPAVPTATPTLDPTITTYTPTIDPTLVTSTIDPENTPEPTPFPSATPVLTADQIILIAVRHDLELLADDQLGLGVRPPGWSGASDYFDPQFALLARSDLETITSALINPSTRPPTWIGAFPSTPYAVARDVRFDLEILMDLTYGRDIRPEGWIGGDPLLRCNRATQTLIALLERGGVFRLEVPANTPNFCREAELAVTKFTETQILANAQLTDLFTEQVSILSPNQISTDIAIAFLDKQASRSVGTIPNGTPIQIVARSYTQFSNMTLISGDQFMVFVDYTNTTVTEQQFRNLPNVDSIEYSTFCFAEWCG